jgi:hypothetical protein
MKLIDLANRRRAVILSNFEFDTDFQAVIDKAIAESFDLPPYPVLRAMNYKLKQMKFFGIWAKLDTYYNFATNSTSFANFSRICWKRRVLGTINGGLITTVNGFEGNGVDGYFGTEYNPNLDGINYTLDNAARGAIIYKSGSSTSNDSISGRLNNGDNFLNRNVSAQRINQGSSNLNSAADLSGLGLKTINRQNSSDVMLSSLATEINRTANSVSIVSQELLFFRSAGVNYADLGLSMGYSGGALTFAETQNFRTAYNQYLNKIGLTQFA